MDLILRCLYLCTYRYILIVPILPSYIGRRKNHEYYQESSQICHVESLCMFSHQDGITPLYISSQKGHVEVVTLLVSRGADLNLAMQVSTRIGCVYKQIRMNMYITRNGCIINEYNILIRRIFDIWKW